MIPTQAQQQFAAAAPAPVWEADAGASAVHNDNAWLLSFIDILALLLTLFVLLLAYESQGPDTGDTTESLLQHQPQHSDPAPVVEAAPQIPSQLPQPITLFSSLSPVFAGSEPSFIDLPIAGAVSPRHPVPATEPAEPDSPASVAEATHAAAANAIDAPAVASPESSSSVPPVAQAAGDLMPLLNLPVVPVQTAVAASPLPPESSPAVASGVDLPHSPTTDAADPSVASPRDTLLATLAGSALRERIEVTVSSDAVNLEISDNILFRPASAALTADGAAVLEELAAAFAEVPFTLSVEGHTDNIPIQTARFPSNWELSSARAAMVTRKLIERGVAADRVRAIGYGETRPRADNETPQGRSRNRRVSFVLQASSAAPAALTN
ncbi:MAG: OmpA family protein [Thiogranum sp.]|nr:OmpA family protein [Thiogranum sp.]